MPLISVDQYLSERQAFVRGDAVMKAFRAPASWNAEARSARFVMSSETPDRDNDIVLQAGINMDAFLQNPVALLFHKSRGFPVGKWTGVERVLNGRPKRTEGTLEFVPAGIDEEADRAAAHVGFGTLRTVSIGFIPTAIRMREQDPNNCGWPGYEILECELVECSLVPVPANPDAIVKSVRDGTMEFRAGRELIEEILDTYVKTPAGLIMTRADLEAAYRDLNAGRSVPVTLDLGDPEEDGEAATGDPASPCDPQEDGMKPEEGGAPGGPGQPTAQKSAMSAIRSRFEGVLKRLGISFDPTGEAAHPADPEKKAALIMRTADIEARVRKALAN